MSMSAKDSSILLPSATCMGVLYCTVLYRTVLYLYGGAGVQVVAVPARVTGGGHLASAWTCPKCSDNKDTSVLSNFITLS